MVKRVALTAIATATFTLSLQAERISGAGASFPAPLYYDWAYDYHKATGKEVNYQSIGSGGGIKQVGSRIVDFGASDKPLKPKKLDKKRLYQFPAVIGSIVVVYNIPGIGDAELRLENKDIADIFMGKIRYWDDKAIAQDNPHLKLPHEKITVIHRSDGSGTTFNFSYFLSNVSEDWRNEIGVGKALSWPTGIGAKGNEGISNLLKQTPYSIGYVEYAYKKRNSFSAATIQTKNGKWVKPAEENFIAAAKYASWDPNKHFYQILALQPGDNSYPIVAATFILLPREKNETNKKVTAFFDWAFKNGDESAQRLGYIPLPQSTKDMIRAYWKKHNIDPSN